MNTETGEIYWNELAIANARATAKPGVVVDVPPEVVGEAYRQTEGQTFSDLAERREAVNARIRQLMGRHG